MKYSKKENPYLDTDFLLRSLYSYYPKKHSFVKRKSWYKAVLYGNL